MPTFRVRYGIAWSTGYRKLEAEPVQAASADEARKKIAGELAAANLDFRIESVEQVEGGD